MALTRPVQPMPEDVAARLEERGLCEAYDACPAYQRNDYLAWIARARRPETRDRRLAQMLDELAEDGIYMRMDHPASAR